MLKQKETTNWKNILKNKVQPAFMSPWQEELTEKKFKSTVDETLNIITSLKGNKENGKCFLGEAKSYMENENDIINVKKLAAMPEKSSCIKEVLEEASHYFNGMFNWGHPKSMINVIPPAATPSIMGNLMASVYNPNLVEQNYSGNITALEIEVASMISKLVGYDPVKSSGHFTFGGTGAYLFATKLALTKCLGTNSRNEGIRTDAQILVSDVGHFAMKNCSDWTGLGMNNVRTIKINKDSSMNLNHLEEVMEQCHKEGKPIAMIVATMGTTDAFAMDDIKGISKICDRFVKKHNLKNRPFIYADAVIGWAWSVFNSYDFKNNPMEFTEDTLKAIEKYKEKTENLCLADALGIDFHKTGFTSYNCSMICVRDNKDFELLARDKSNMAYLYQFSLYTPGEYTLECSRGGNYALTAWCNLKYFGLEGYRAILGSLIESEKSLRNIIEKEPSMVCVNEEDHGFVTLFRVYPSSLKDSIKCENFAKEQYKNEFENPNYKNQLEKFNDYQFKVSQELQRMIYEEDGPALSFTSKFRLTAYGEPIGAIKAYPMSPYLTSDEEQLREDVIKYILKAVKNVNKQFEDKEFKSVV